MRDIHSVTDDEYVGALEGAVVRFEIDGAREGAYQRAMVVGDRGASRLAEGINFGPSSRRKSASKSLMA